MRVHCAHIICRCVVNLIGNCCACGRVTAEGNCHYRWESFSPERHGNSVNRLQSCDREFNRAVAVRPLMCFNPVLASPPSSPDYCVVGRRRSTSCVVSGRISFSLSIDTTSRCEFSWPLVDLIIPHPPTALCSGLMQMTVTPCLLSSTHLPYALPLAPCTQIHAKQHNSCANILLTLNVFCLLTFSLIFFFFLVRI